MTLRTDPMLVLMFVQFHLEWTAGHPDLPERLAMLKSMCTSITSSLQHGPPPSLSSQPFNYLGICDTLRLIIRDCLDHGVRHQICLEWLLHRRTENTRQSPTQHTVHCAADCARSSNR